MNRMFAIIEREMRRFFRSPTLMVMSLMMPLLMLVIMGNAFGGKIVGERVAVVDYDHGPEAVNSARPWFHRVNIKTFTTIEYTSEVQAREDVRTGKIDAAVVIPPILAPCFMRRKLRASAWLSTTLTHSALAASKPRCSWWLPRSPPPSSSRGLPARLPWK